MYHSISDKELAAQSSPRYGSGPYTSTTTSHVTAPEHTYRVNSAPARAASTDAPPFGGGSTLSATAAPFMPANQPREQGHSSKSPWPLCPPSQPSKSPWPLSPPRHPSQSPWGPPASLQPVPRQPVFDPIMPRRQPTVPSGSDRSFLARQAPHNAQIRAPTGPRNTRPLAQSALDKARIHLSRKQQERAIGFDSLDDKEFIPNIRDP
ncbi:hypothetical protein F5Y13DRAFT_191979 [Hypoxylon sp. FL1857]|nr:hypothetical protein F5Y13DRAFT_191979 [Hypoxylon sp. FL1857]